MKLLYVSEHRFIKKKNGDVFTTGQMSENYFSRFKDGFEQVSVIGLCEDENEANTGKIIERVDLNSDFVQYVLIHSSGTIIGRLDANRRIKKEYNKLLSFYDRVATKAPSLIIDFVVRRARIYNVPFLIEMVGCPWDALWNHGLKGKIIAPLVWFNVRKAIRNAPYVVYVTNNFLQQRYPTKGINTNCSNVSLNEFDEEILKARIEKISKINLSDKIIIGTTAAVNVKYKGQQYIIEALSKLKKQGILGFEYQLVGGGDPTYLKSVAAKFDVLDQVKFLGSMPHDEVFDWLDTIDIYAQPSTTEGLPRSLIEAMSCGIPAFGSEAGGIPELLNSKMIFSNSKSRIDEILLIMQELSKDEMLIQAKRNFEESKKYDAKIINKRREEFIAKFCVSKFSNKKMINTI